MMNFKKILAILSVFALLCTAQAHADQYDNFECQDGSGCCSDWLSCFRIDAEFLWWKAVQDGLCFAEVETEIFDDVTAGFTTKENPNFKWTPGVRIGLGYQFPCNQWESDFVWTHLIGRAAGFAETTNAGEVGAVPIILPTLLTSGSVVSTPISNGTEVNTISANWHISFNNFDWTIGRKVDLSCGLLFKPYGGLRYTNFKQRYILSYVRNVPLVGVLAQTIESRLSSPGLVAGFKTEWRIGCDLSLYTDAAVGVTYGRVKVNDSRAEVGEVGDFSLLRRIHQRVATPNIDLAIGFNWEKEICNFPLDLFFGWEYHHYFSQNFFSLPNDCQRGGDLVLYGLNIGAGISF